MAVFGFYEDDTPPYLQDLAMWFFPIPEDETEAQGAMLWQHWTDPDQIAERDEEAATKWLPEVLPIMEILLESL